MPTPPLSRGGGGRGCVLALSTKALLSPPPAQLQNQSELRAPTAEKAAYYLDAALAARSTSRAGCPEDARSSSHMLFTLHVYQYRVEKRGKGGSRCPCAKGWGWGGGWAASWRGASPAGPALSVSGGRSRLHLLDLGSCEGAPGGSPGLSLSALGSVILALVSGAKHVPYR